MSRYCVNTSPQPNGDHEVHDVSLCNRLPAASNQKDLGYHASCGPAVALAKAYYSKANGCWYCASSCHTK